MNPQQLLAHVNRLRTTLSAGQIASLIAAFVAVVGVIAGSAYWASTPSYSVLFHELDPESANAAITRLKAGNVEYRLENGGTTLLVPAVRLDELRLEFASQGLPLTGRIGFEIFDRTSFGTTEFLEQVNYRRGLEGELGRTIGTIRDVASARVHIALAKDSLFTEAAKQAKASVVLKLRNQKPLAPSTVAGIANLVASAVESLRPESVVIVDTFGRPLSKPEKDDTAGPDVEEQQQFERDLTSRVVSLLEPVVGPGRVRVNVAAQFSADTAEETEEVWDPNPVLRSRQSSSDTSASASSASKAARAGGVAGARANQPPDNSSANPQALQVSGSEGTSGRMTETVNYEIGRKTRHRVEPSGQIERLSVAVIVDDARTPGAEGKPATNKPRDAAEMERIKGLVAASVGLSTERGDQLTVENIAFEEAPEAVEAPAGPWWTQVSPTVQDTLGVSVGDVMRWVLVGVIALIALFAVIRPMMRVALGPATAVPALAPAGAASALPPGAMPALTGGKTVAELEGEMQAAAAGRPAGRVSSLKGIAAKAEQDPEHVAKLVRAMLAQEDR
ncbi:MAG: flagellar M-ring protein FliF [Acidobacteria bacterium]|nr:flagellar M-ring protein FliF [Acidobacteriota bacterium]